MATKPKAAPRNASWHVYSTLTNATSYVEWEASAGRDVMRVRYGVTIRGGAGVANNRTLITPFGVRTEVTQEQMDFLHANAEFQRHIKEGWIKVTKASAWGTDPDVVAADMQQRDGSAPLVPNDFEGKEPTYTGVRGVGTEPTKAPRTVPLARPVNNMVM